MSMTPDISGPIAFLDGTYVSAHDARVSVTDAGFVMGVTVAEQVRTFAGAPFQLDRHLDRLFHGLDLVGVGCPHSRGELAEIVDRVVRHNRRQLAAEDDLGVTLFVTPGIYSAYATEDRVSPTCGVHTYPLPFRLWHGRYASGASLQSVSVQQVSSRSWPVDLKCRSRMHYYLATQEARAHRPGSMAVLLDERGQVTETPTANVVAYFADEGLVSPGRENILPGISLAFLRDLAESQGLPFHERPLTMDDLRRGAEVLLTSTPFCLLPVQEVDGQPLPTARTIYDRLLSAWSAHVGLDIAAQARRFAMR
jgi:branched-chain amino acid aminotransferase